MVEEEEEEEEEIDIFTKFLQENEKAAASGAP